MLIVYRKRGQGKLGVRKQHIKLLNQDLLRFVLLDRLEGKEPEMGNAYSLQVKKSKEVRCWETANKSFDKAFDVLRFRC